MKKILGFGALFLIVPILLSGCSSNTSASTISDYDEVSLIEYQECLALMGPGVLSDQKVRSKAEWNTDQQKFFYPVSAVMNFVLENCKKYRPVKEEVPLSVK